MQATRVKQATLDDLLERLLDKGIILNLDLVIGVANIPLIGINLRAAIASIETMIEYGFMQAWDEDVRAYAATEIQRKKMALAPGESIRLEMFGSHWYANGIYRAWRPGRLFLTDRRLILYRVEPAEVLFQTPLTAIQDWMVTTETHFTGTERDLIYLALASGETAAIYAEDVGRLEGALQQSITVPMVLVAESAIPFQRDRAVGAIIQEKTVADGKLWRQSPAAGIHGPLWRPGWLYLTVDRLLWWSEFDCRIEVEIPLSQLQGLRLEARDLGGFLNTKEVLAVVSRQRHSRVEELFAGELLAQWQREIKAQVLDYGGGGFDAEY